MYKDTLSVDCALTKLASGDYIARCSNHHQVKKAVHSPIEHHRLSGKTGFPEIKHISWNVISTTRPPSPSRTVQPSLCLRSPTSSLAETRRRMRTAKDSRRACHDLRQVRGEGHPHGCCGSLGANSGCGASQSGHDCDGNPNRVPRPASRGSFRC